MCTDSAEEGEVVVVVKKLVHSPVLTRVLTVTEWLPTTLPLKRSLAEAVLWHSVTFRQN